MHWWRAHSFVLPSQIKWKVLYVGFMLIVNVNRTRDLTTNRPAPPTEPQPPLLLTYKWWSKLHPRLSYFVLPLVPLFFEKNIKHLFCFCLHKTSYLHSRVWIWLWSNVYFCECSLTCMCLVEAHLLLFISDRLLVFFSNNKEINWICPYRIKYGLQL